jgi:hypothetical protein
MSRLHCSHSPFGPWRPGDYAAEETSSCAPWACMLCAISREYAHRVECHFSLASPKDVTHAIWWEVSTRKSHAGFMARTQGLAWTWLPPIQFRRSIAT